MSVCPSPRRSQCCVRGCVARCITRARIEGGDHRDHVLSAQPRPIGLVEQVAARVDEGVRGPGGDDAHGACVHPRLLSGQPVGAVDHSLRSA